MVTTSKRGQGVEMLKLETERLMCSTKQVFWGSVSTTFVDVEGSSSQYTHVNS